MAFYIDVLRKKAFDSMPGPAYNQYREKELNKQGPKITYFEVALLADKPWAYVRDRIYPVYVRFLKNKSLDPESGEGTVIALFHGKVCYLLEGKDFLAAFREIERLNPTAFHFRIQWWLSE